MHRQHDYCSYCGARFADDLPWPRPCAGCGNKSYLNPLPVVVVLVPVGGGVVVVRRNIEPSKGTLTLSGGYIDCGETWQEAGSRELIEETGIAVPPAQIRLYDVQNGLDDTLVIFGLAAEQGAECLKPFFCDETMEVRLIEEPMELGFPMHTEIVRRYFEERERKAREELKG